MAGNGTPPSPPELNDHDYLPNRPRVGGARTPTRGRGRRGRPPLSRRNIEVLEVVEVEATINNHTSNLNSASAPTAGPSNNSPGVGNGSMSSQSSNTPGPSGYGRKGSTRRGSGRIRQHREDSEDEEEWFPNEVARQNAKRRHENATVDTQDGDVDIDLTNDASTLNSSSADSRPCRISISSCGRIMDQICEEEAEYIYSFYDLSKDSHPELEKAFEKWDTGSRVDLREIRRRLGQTTIYSKPQDFFADVNSMIGNCQRLIPKRHPMAKLTDRFKEKFRSTFYNAFHKAPGFEDLSLEQGPYSASTSTYPKPTGQINHATTEDENGIIYLDDEPIVIPGSSTPGIDRETFNDIDADIQNSIWESIKRSSARNTGSCSSSPQSDATVPIPPLENDDEIETENEMGDENDNDDGQEAPETENPPTPSSGGDNSNSNEIINNAQDGDNQQSPENVQTNRNCESREEEVQNQTDQCDFASSIDNPGAHQSNHCSNSVPSQNRIQTGPTATTSSKAQGHNQESELSRFAGARHRKYMAAAARKMQNYNTQADPKIREIIQKINDLQKNHRTIVADVAELIRVREEPHKFPDKKEFAIDLKILRPSTLTAIKEWLDEREREITTSCGPS